MDSERQKNSVVFRMPGERSFQRIEESDDGGLEVSIVPFLEERSSVPVIRFKGESEPWEFDPGKLANAESELIFDSYTYNQAFEKMHDALASGGLKKVVLSASASIRWPGALPTLLDSLAESQPKAFVYWFESASGDQWIGATPELLLTRTGQDYRTMSLAGTKLNAETPWTEKEISEQGLVTEYIEEAIASVDSNTRIMTNSYDRQTGHLLHRCTEISFSSTLPEQDFLSALHPTPAVCGVPKEMALELIEEVEVHHREYYSGYIGISGVQHSHYFVNLRTAKRLDGGLMLYAGGGLLSESELTAERNEILAKMSTITRHLTR